MRLKSYAAQTNQGPYLQINEDGYDFDFNNDLFLVLDGFGGSGNGDKSTERLKNDIKNFYTQISDDPNATMPLYYSQKNLLEGNALVNSLLNAHQKLLKENSEKPLNLKSGASCVVSALSENILITISIGCARAYHFREGVLTKLIDDDSFMLHTKNSFSSKFRSFPMSALGLYPDLNYQLKEVRVTTGDKVLFLTDGVYLNLSEEEISYNLGKSSIDNQTRINNLLKLSNDRGNLDNLTAMILEF